MSSFVNSQLSRSIKRRGSAGSYGSVIYKDMEGYDNTLKTHHDNAKQIRFHRTSGVPTIYNKGHNNIPNWYGDCFKMLVSFDESAPNEIGNVLALYKRLQKDNFIKYTPYRLVQEDVYCIEFVMNDDSTVYMIPCQYFDSLITATKFQSVVEYYNAQNQLIEKIHFLNKNGIFHRDIKPENVMYHDNEVHIIDFGSCFIDKEGYQISKSNDNELTRTIFRHPLTSLHYDFLPTTIGGIHNFTDLIQKTPFADLLKKQTNEEQHQRLLRYLLHKNDCTACAFLIHKVLTPPFGGGLFSSCFGDKCKVKAAPNDEPKKELEFNEFQSKFDRITNQQTQENVAKLMYWSIEDFNTFISTYRITDSPVVKRNNWVNEGGRPTKASTKTYIIIRTTNKQFLLRGDSQGKYILANKEKLYLKDIKGKYIYKK